MLWYLAAGMLLALAFSLLVWSFMRDRRYLKKRTSEAMARALWDEIQSEREASRVRRERFLAALDHARDKEHIPTHEPHEHANPG